MTAEANEPAVRPEGWPKQANEPVSSARTMAETYTKPRRPGVVTILYSLHREVYKIPSAGVDLWMSVQIYPPSDLGSFASSVGIAQTADGKGWRRAYRNWAIITPGATAAIPADDALVVDYLRRAKAEPSIPKSLFPAGAGERDLKV
jgi:hypothetical protein